MTEISRRGFIALGLGAVAWSACKRGSGIPTSSPTIAPDKALSVQQATSELALGDKRFAFALFRGQLPVAAGGPTELLVTPPGLPPVKATAQPVSIELGVGGGTPVAGHTHPPGAEPHQHPREGGQGAEVHDILVVEHDFDRPGVWNMQLRTNLAQGGPHPKLSVQVLERSESPMVGAKALPTQTPTVADARGVDPICTRTPRCSMHEVTVAQAVQSGRPSLITFSTPKFCASRTCGPTVDIVEAAKSSFAGVHFVHVEVYNGAPPNHAPAVQEWKLPGEPWIVFVGADGLVKARWSGAMGQSELEKALPKLVDGSLGATAGA